MDILPVTDHSPSLPRMQLSANERRDLIRSIILREGQANANRLASDLQVSVETIRRDMKTLEDSGFVSRIHGGAKAASVYALPHIDLRIGTDRAAKERIARLAAPLVEPGMSVFFSGGSTVLALAWQLREGPRIDATTVMIDVGMVLAAGVQTEVTLCGGQLNPVSRACVGFEAAEMVGRRHFDLAFLGASGIDPARGMLGPSELHLQLAQTVRRQSSRVVVIAPDSTIRSSDRLQMLSLQQIDILVTDRPPAPALFRALETSQVSVLF